MSQIAIETKIIFNTHTCRNCGGTYALNAEYDRERRVDGKWWNCPYCPSSWHYGDGELEKVKKQLAQEQQQHDQTRAARDEFKRSYIGQKAATTRLKNRLSKGTCPCCDQQFDDLADHMKTAHPDFSSEE